MYNIVWKGNANTNKSSRGNFIPLGIVNHITEGSFTGADEWLSNIRNNNKVSSAHFQVGKKGQIHQYVSIDDMAWANGLSNLNIATAQIIKDNRYNPNLYTVSIEHEGFWSQGKGELTEEQFQATVWLHKYIQKYIKDKYNYDMKFDRYHIIGHDEIHPINRPNCPGQSFPWTRLISELNKKEVIKVEKPIEQWQIDILKYIHDNKLIDTDKFEYHKERLNHPAENWMVFALIKKLHEQNRQNINEIINTLKSIKEV